LNVAHVARREGKDGIYQNCACAGAMGDNGFERSHRVAEVELESVRNHHPKVKADIPSWPNSAQNALAVSPLPDVAAERLIRPGRHPS
jgi:hypothetical protein